MRLIRFLRQIFQRILLVLSYWACRVVIPRQRKDSIDWVVEPDDIASMSFFISNAVAHSRYVVIRPNQYYLHSRCNTKFTNTVRGPLILGYYLNLSRGFIYVGGGYLSTRDHRRFEFRFLKKHHKALVIYWTGSDVRSTKLMNEYEAQSGIPNIATYISLVKPRLGTEEDDKCKRLSAQVADRYADAMFSFSSANRSYLSRSIEPFLYLYPDNRFIQNLSKFSDVSCPVIVHAPSSMIIKGTQLVRAAVDKLRNEAYDFEYIELVNKPNEVVLEELQRAHIALGHFYGFTPGVFGVEAMASACALVISADEFEEPMLPPGSNQAWLVTKHWQVYDNIKLLLDKPGRIEQLAVYGRDWAKNHFSASANTATLNAVLEKAFQRESPTIPDEPGGKFGNQFRRF